MKNKLFVYSFNLTHYYTMDITSLPKELLMDCSLLELNHLRATCKQFHTQFGSIFGNRLIQKIKETLQTIFGAEYHAFLKMMETNNVQIFGPIINRWLCGSKYNIPVILLYDNLTPKKDCDHDKCTMPQDFCQVIPHFHKFVIESPMQHDIDRLRYRTIDSTSTISYYIIEGNIMGFIKTFPNRLQNYIKVIDGKLEITIMDINKVFSKNESLAPETNNRVYFPLMNLLDVNCHASFGKYVRTTYNVPALVYKPNGQFIIYEKLYQSQLSGCISFVSQNKKICIQIDYRKVTQKCSDCMCILDKYTAKYYHNYFKIKYDDGNFTDIACLIKYEDTPDFALYTEIFNKGIFG